MFVCEMMEKIPRPLPESYWVVPDRLLAGEYPAQMDEELTRKRLEALITSGFDMFIDLTIREEADEALPYRDTLLEVAHTYQVEATYQRFPIGDFGLPSPERMNSILDAIDGGLRAGRKIYLHCLGGIGRTGTAVGCYLVRQGKTGAEALDQLSTWWRTVPKSRYSPRSPETDAQRDFILQWAQHDPKP